MPGAELRREMLEYRKKCKYLMVKLSLERCKCGLDESCALGRGMMV